MPTKTWVVGEEVLAADFNTMVQQQVVSTFPNTAARDTWTSPPDGALSLTTDTYSLWMRRAGAWTYAAPRCGADVSTAGQSIASGGLAAIAWTAEYFDTDNFHASGSTDLVIPANLGGVYAISVNLNAAAAPTQTSDVQIFGNTNLIGNFYFPIGKGIATGTLILSAASGATFSVKVYNGSINAVTFSGSFRAFRLQP